MKREGDPVSLENRKKGLKSKASYKNIKKVFEPTASWNHGTQHLMLLSVTMGQDHCGFPKVRKHHRSKF